MSRVDDQGAEHPTRDDPWSAEGLEHIDGCAECRENIPGVADFLSLNFPRAWKEPARG